MTDTDTADTTKTPEQKVLARYNAVADYYPNEADDLQRAFALGQLQGIHGAAHILGVELPSLDDLRLRLNEDELTRAAWRAECDRLQV